VREIVTEREQVARRAEEKAAALSALVHRLAWRAVPAADGLVPVERRILSGSLETLAVYDFETPEKDRVLATEVLQAVGARADRPSVGGALFACCVARADSLRTMRTSPSCASGCAPPSARRFWGRLPKQPPAISTERGGAI
jgi:hypothetical protein